MLGGPEPRVQRGGDRADAQRAEERRRQIEAVGQQHRDTVPAPDPALTQRAPHSTGRREEVDVAVRGGRGRDRRMTAPARRDVRVEERRDGVHLDVGGRIAHGLRT